MTIIEIVGLIVSVLTILGFLVTLTAYISKLWFKVKQEKLELEKEFTEKGLRDLEAKHKDLLNQIAVARKNGTAVLTRKLEIDEELADLMQIIQAKAGSIYIPIRSKNSIEPQGLAFLSIQPFGREAAALKSKIIPIQSFAGRCFMTGLPSIDSNAKNNPEHYDKADKVSGYRTQSVLNFPLKDQDNTIGVVQLLNKEGAEKFDENDLKHVEPFARAIALKVSKFIQIPESLDILGIAPDRDVQYATIMFCDLTHSSLLFRELSTPAAIQHLNEYFEQICEVAFDYNATVDKYMGDGVILRFNVPRPVEDHPMKAVKAALEIQTIFDKLKKDWIIMGDLVEDIYIRFGIAYGQVYQAEVGHPQYRYLTLFGPPVNVAVNLCETARRDRNVIVIDEMLYQKLDKKLDVVIVPKERLGKASTFVSSAYELRSLAVNERVRNV